MPYFWVCTGPCHEQLYEQGKLKNWDLLVVYQYPHCCAPTDQRSTFKLINLVWTDHPLQGKPNYEKQMCWRCCHVLICWQPHTKVNELPCTEAPLFEQVLLQPCLSLSLLVLLMRSNRCPVLQQAPPTWISEFTTVLHLLHWLIADVPMTDCNRSVLIILSSCGVGVVLCSLHHIACTNTKKTKWRPVELEELEGPCLWHACPWPHCSVCATSIDLASGAHSPLCYLQGLFIVGGCHCYGAVSEDSGLWLCLVAGVSMCWSAVLDLISGPIPIA